MDNDSDNEYKEPIKYKVLNSIKYWFGFDHYCYKFFPTYGFLNNYFLIKENKMKSLMDKIKNGNLDVNETSLKRSNFPVLSLAVVYNRFEIVKMLVDFKGILKSWC